MPVHRTIEEEQELCETYLRRWREVLYMGNWHIEIFVKPKEVWTNPELEYTLWDTDGCVAKIYVLYTADREPDNSLSWNNNLELLVLHELGHTFCGEYMPTVPMSWHKKDGERFVNKLSILFYELFHKDDPTKGDYDK